MQVCACAWLQQPLGRAFHITQHLALFKKINKNDQKPQCPFVLEFGPWKAFSFWEQMMCLCLTTLAQ